jgi:hypothetical protein
MDTMCRKGSSQQSLVDEFLSYARLLPSALRSVFETTQFPKLMRLIQAKLGVSFMPSITVDVCPNDCILYRQAFRDHIMCPNFGCEVSRFGPDGSPARQFTFLYLIPRVRRIFSSMNWSRMMGYAASRSAPDGGWVHDVLDGSAFHRLFGDGPGQLPISKYNLGWSFGADGLPISKRDKTYSTCPLLWHLCTLCPWLRYLWDYLFTTGFTPGPGKNNVAIFLQQVSEEFERAWRLGFMVWDVLTGLWHRVKMAVLFGVFDLRGTAAITDGNQSPAIQHCHLCDVEGEYLKPYSSTYYNGDWVKIPRGPLRTSCELRKFPGMPDPPHPIQARTEIAAAAACAESENSRFFFYYYYYYYHYYYYYFYCVHQ